MASYPPPPPYGNDWKYQRRVLKEQARVQRDVARAQRDAYRYQLRGQRRSSILGPLMLIALGVVFLLVQTGHLETHAVWEWYARFWPLLLVGAGIIMLIEWAFDQYMQSDSTQPQYRRRVGGGVFTLLLILGIAGIVFSSARHNGNALLHGLNMDQNNWDEFLGDKHESDQMLSQDFPAGSNLTVDNSHGDVTINGTSDDNQIHVSAHKEVYTSSDSDAASRSDRISPHISSNGTTLNVNVPPLDGTRVDLTITVPASAGAIVNSNRGDVHVSSIKAPVTVTANHGDIELSAITGAVTTHINNSSSDLSAHSVTGALTIEGRGHDTTLSDLTGPVSMRGDFFGTTHFERIAGPIRFHTSRTDFQLARLDGEVEISNNADLTTTNAVGPVTLTTGNRNITLDRVSGDISVTNRNGSVDVTSAPPLSNITIENRNGSVNIGLPEANFAYQLDATNGDIETDFSGINIPEGGVQKKIVSGSAGKGGPLLRISTTQGDISLKKASVMPLPPAPPAPPKLTVPDASDAKEAAREAKQAAKEAADEARQAAREAAAEAKQAAKELKQQSKDKDK